MEEDHPVKLWCRRVIALADAGKWSDARRERFVLDNGVPFMGAERPEGYRKGRDKHCFANAARLAFNGRGTYVEGFATSGLVVRFITPGSRSTVRRRWIRPWRDPANCQYFGVPFGPTALSMMSARGTYGMLDPFDANFLKASLFHPD